MKNDIKALVLAGGLGTRMKSDKAKVLHEICGYSLISHVVMNLQETGLTKENIGIVVGHQAEDVKSNTENKYNYFLQEKPLGTGHALIVSSDFFKDAKGKLLVLCGDAPLIDHECINEFVNYAEDEDLDLAVLTAKLDNPAMYGRIIRNGNSLEKIVEYKDASTSERKVNEINSGTYLFDMEKLAAHINDLDNNNTQKEYYLTDMVEIFIKSGYRAGACITSNNNIVQAANNRYELSQCEEIMREKINKNHMISGVTIKDKNATYIDRNVEIGVDTVIYPNTIIEKNTKIGKENIIYASRIANSVIENGNKIDNCVINDSSIANNTKIGPYTQLRPGSIVGNDVKLGNFVEVKNSTLGENTKVSHLTYVGDGKVGKNTNIGCGVVFVNYDGEKKSLTEIGDDCFIGCNTNLVAPITVEDGVYVAAGSTLTEDVPKDNLAIARARQVNKNDWNKKKK